MYATYLHNNKMILYDNALHIINPYLCTQSKNIFRTWIEGKVYKYIITIEIEIDKCYLNNSKRIIIILISELHRIKSHFNWYTLYLHTGEDV